MDMDGLDAPETNAAWRRQLYLSPQQPKQRLAKPALLHEDIRVRHPVQPPDIVIRSFYSLMYVL